MQTNELMTELGSTISALMAHGKGLLAADESNTTIAARFRPFAIESTEENRRRYRQMLFTTPGLETYISGVILFDETIRQRTDDGRSFVELLGELGITPGIKVDGGCADGDGAPERDEHDAGRTSVATQLLLCARVAGARAGGMAR